MNRNITSPDTGHTLPFRLAKYPGFYVSDIFNIYKCTMIPAKEDYPENLPAQISFRAPVMLIPPEQSVHIYPDNKIQYSAP